MRLVVTLLLAIASVCTSGRALVEAQSLAEVARREAERRRSLREEGVLQPGEVKVYTNKDLTSVPAPPAPTPPTAPQSTGSQTDAGASGDAAPADAAAAAADGQASAAADATSAETQPVARDRAYWSSRMAELRAALERDQVYAEALQTRINSLKTDFTARDDPFQRATIAVDLQKTLDTLASLQETIEERKAAIADLEEEARRAGVPPGWLR